MSRRFAARTAARYLMHLCAVAGIWRKIEKLSPTELRNCDYRVGIVVV